MASWNEPDPASWLIVFYFLSVTQWTKSDIARSLVLICSQFSFHCHRWSFWGCLCSLWTHALLSAWKHLLSLGETPRHRTNRLHRWCQETAKLLSKEPAQLCNSRALGDVPPNNGDGCCGLFNVHNSVSVNSLWAPSIRSILQKSCKPLMLSSLSRPWQYCGQNPKFCFLEYSVHSF